MQEFLDEISIWTGGLTKLKSPPHEGGHLLICWEQKGSRRNLLHFSASLLKLSHLISSSAALGLGFMSSAAPDSQAFRLGLNYTPGFLESPVCRQHILGLLCLYNHLRQFLIINLLCILLVLFSLTKVDPLVSVNPLLTSYLELMRFQLNSSQISNPQKWCRKTHFTIVLRC